jgi:uncharacterized protein YkwD
MMKKSFVALMMILWVWIACMAGSGQSPDISDLEEKLLEWLNKERTIRHLKPLSYSQELRTVAEKHSQDMASQKKLTHRSSSRNSYLDRLVEAGIFFIEIGENVAVSDISDAAFIHQGFMESTEHRDNILNPNYDTVGIGVVHSKDREFYITQDFSQSLEILDIDKAEKSVQDEITKIRKESVLPPLSFHNQANTFARRHSRNKATGRPLQNMAVYFGETHIHFITTPHLTIPKNISTKIANEMYEIGAVGAWFGRLKDYPGGTYLITIFLFPTGQYKDMTEEDFQKMALEAMNSIRRDMGLDPVKLDRGYSREASSISRNLGVQQENTYVITSSLMRHEITSYMTDDPRVWPTSLNQVIADPGLRRIGIGISFEENIETHQKTFWITLIR